MDCSLPGSSIQARILESLAIPIFGGFSQSRGYCQIHLSLFFHRFLLIISPCVFYSNFKFPNTKDQIVFTKVLMIPKLLNSWIVFRSHLSWRYSSIWYCWLYLPSWNPLLQWFSQHHISPYASVFYGKVSLTATYSSKVTNATDSQGLVLAPPSVLHTKTI